MKVFVTGGVGYIGSHTLVDLLEHGHHVCVLDNLSNSNKRALDRVQEIAQKSCEFVQADILDTPNLIHLFKNNQFDAVIHFAGLKSVGESVRLPLHYYMNNVVGTLSLLQAMQAVELKKIVFSSSAVVYGNPQVLPLQETHPLSTMSPYGRSKWMIEDILRDLYRSDPSWSIAILRYVNPVGAHPSGKIGENPLEVPNNLMPYIAQVASGLHPFLNVWGNDYATEDGTGVRDYIHVCDLARGHLKALDKLNLPMCEAFNLSTGVGYSVLELVAAFERVSGQKIPYQFKPRREGDVAISYSSPLKALQVLDWQAERSLDEMCRDTWHWQSKNPLGY